MYIALFSLSGLFYQPDSSAHHMILSNTYQMKFWEVYQIIGSKEMVSMRDFLLMMTVLINFIAII